MADSEKKKLNDLRVVDLKSELEKRSLEITGVKTILIERLQKVNFKFRFKNTWIIEGNKAFERDFDVVVIVQLRFLQVFDI